MSFEMREFPYESLVIPKPMTVTVKLGAGPSVDYPAVREIATVERVLYLHFSDGRKVERIPFDQGVTYLAVKTFALFASWRIPVGSRFRPCPSSSMYQKGERGLM